MAQVKQVRRKSGGGPSGTPRQSKAPRKSLGSKTTPGSASRRPRAQRKRQSACAKNFVLTLLQPATQYHSPPTDLAGTDPALSPCARSGATSNQPTCSYSNSHSNGLCARYVSIYCLSMSPKKCAGRAKPLWPYRKPAKPS